MEIIDNINRLLGDNLKQSITPGAKLKIAASCFSIYAFEALKAELEQIDSLEFILPAPPSSRTKSPIRSAASAANSTSRNSSGNAAFTAPNLKFV